MVTRIAIFVLTALIVGIAQPTAVKVQSGPNYASVNISSVNPTTNTGGVQAGLGLQLTPNSSGVVQIIAQVTGKNSIAGKGISVQIDYGTGTPPRNGVISPPAGAIAVGSWQTSMSSTNHEENALAVTSIISGLTLATTYWFDLIEAAVFGGTAQLYDIVITAVEL
jgi:hypothetical protein